MRNGKKSKEIFFRHKVKNTERFLQDLGLNYPFISYIMVI